MHVPKLGRYMTTAHGPNQYITQQARLWSQGGRNHMRADKQRDAGMLLKTQLPDRRADGECGVSPTCGNLLRQPRVLRQRRLQQAAQPP